MVEIKEMDLENNKITYDDFSEVNYSKFYDTFISYWNKKIAGETISPFDIERFMKRSSSKNLKQLIDGKKAEGILEATLGRKMNPDIVKYIIIMVIICAVVGVLFFVLKSMGLL